MWFVPFPTHNVIYNGVSQVFFIKHLKNSNVYINRVFERPDCIDTCYKSKGDLYGKYTASCSYG